MVNKREQMACCAVIGVVWVSLALLGYVRYSPPSPRPADSNSGQFSAERARVILQDLVADGIPHPSGSRQNGVVRERIIKYFRSFGYDPEVQVAQDRQKNSSTNLPIPKNIVVRRQGTLPGRAIMLAGHYDSVARGPGASDDGVAVAAMLEIAGMLQGRQETRNDVIFLVTDAEEDGLFGASAFVEQHPLANQVKVAINLEARGTSGSSLMFETSKDDAWLISLLARQLSRPTTSSLYFEIYTRLPNDTDFTVFKNHGMEGYNFAFVRDVQNYHTSNDDYEHADLGSLQHHGDNAWQLLTALADFDLDQRRPGRAIYTDVLASFVVWWPESINGALAGTILAITLMAGVIARKRQLFFRFKVRVFAALFLPMIAASLLMFFTGVSSGKPSGNPLPVLIGYWVLAVLALVGIAYSALGRADTWSTWCGVWFCWNGIGLAAACFVPGVSYLFMLPGGIAAIAGLLAASLPKLVAPRALLGACCLGAMAAGVFWLPVQVLFYDGLGFTFNPVYPICAGFLTMTALPLVNGPIAQDPGPARAS